MPFFKDSIMLANVSRRDVLRWSAAAPLLARGLWAQEAAADPFGGFRMSLATYSLRKLPVDQALQETKAFGVKTVEINPVHLPVGSPAEKIQEVKGLLEKSGIQAYAFGVLYPDKFKESPEKAIRDAFAQAKEVGIRVISADPDPKHIAFLEELAVKNDIRVGIHNHGPNSRYDKLEQVQKLIEGRDARIGATVDIGHYMRSGEDPVALIRALGKRMHGFHLKDVKAGQAVVVGKGDLDLVGTLRALREAKYEGAVSLEYEVKEVEPLEGIRQCLDAVRDAVKKT